MHIFTPSGILGWIIEYLENDFTRFQDEAGSHMKQFALIMILLFTALILARCAPAEFGQNGRPDRRDQGYVTQERSAIEEWFDTDAQGDRQNGTVQWNDGQARAQTQEWLNSTAQSRPADILPVLETAINRFDVDALLDCYEPSVKKALSGITGMVGSAVGFSGSSAMDLLPFVSQMMGRYASRELGNIKVKLTEAHTTINGGNATMQVIISAMYEGKEESETMTFKLVKVDEKWYLSSENLQNAILDGMFN